MPFNIDLIYPSPPHPPPPRPSLSLASISFPCYAILTRLTTASVVVHPLSLRFRCLMNYIEINLDLSTTISIFISFDIFERKTTIRDYYPSVKFLLPFSHPLPPRISIRSFDRSMIFFFNGSIIDSIRYIKAYKG